MSDVTSVPSARGVRFFAESVTLRKMPGDRKEFSVSQDAGQSVPGDVVETLPVLTRDKYEWDFSLVSQQVHELPEAKAFTPSRGSYLEELGPRQIRYVEIIADPNDAPWNTDDGDLRECDGVLLLEPREGDRPVDGSWWAFRGYVAVDNEPQSTGTCDSCVITFDRDTDFRLVTGLKDGSINEEFFCHHSSFPVIEDVQFWTQHEHQPHDRPDDGTQIQIRLSEERTVRCSHSANHWRTLAFENEDFYINNVYFAPDPDSVPDAMSADGDLGSVDVGESTVKGTVVYLVSADSVDVNARPLPGLAAV